MNFFMQKISIHNEMLNTQDSNWNNNKSVN